MQKFILIEPSKTDAEHLTFNASVISEFLRRFPEQVCLAASPSHFEALGSPAVNLCRLPIVSIVQRRFLSKVLVEAIAIVKAFWRARRSGVQHAVVLSVFPPLFSWLSLVARWFGIPTTLILHGELEGLVDPTRQRITSFGYWVKRFFANGHFRQLQCFVLSEGIHQRLITMYPDAASYVGWGNHPVPQPDFPEVTQRDITFATVGVATVKKHDGLFRQFSRLVKSGQRGAHVGMTEPHLYRQFKQDVTFFCEPGSHLNQAEFVAALKRVKNAVFPYSTTSYRMTVSGAMLDAIGCGCNVVCPPNLFAGDLVNAGLPVTIASDLDQLLVDSDNLVANGIPWHAFSAETFCARLLQCTGVEANDVHLNRSMSL